MSDTRPVSEVDRLRADAARLFADAGSAAPDLILDPALHQVRTDRLQFLFAYWRAIGGMERRARSEALVGLDLGAALGEANLLDAVLSGLDFRYRFHGSWAALPGSVDLTGKLLSEAPFAPHLLAFSMRCYRLSLAAGRPVWAFNPVPGARDGAGVERLILPLVDADGVVHRFLVGVARLDGGSVGADPVARPQPPRGYGGPVESGRPLDFAMPATAGLPAPDLRHAIPSPHGASAAEFRCKTHRRLFEHWTATPRGEGDLPPSRDIDPMAIRAVLDDVILLEPVAEGTDFAFRVFGAAVARVLGRDMTGRSLRDLHASAVTTLTVCYTMARANRVPFYFEHDALAEVSDSVRWCRLVLPYQNAWGTVDRLLVGNVCLPRTQDPPG